MQKETSNTPFFLICLYAALFSLGIGIGFILLLCALCFLSVDPALYAGYGANIALLLTSFLCGLFAARALSKPSQKGSVSIVGSLTSGAIVFCLLLGLSLLIPSDHTSRLSHLLTTLPVYALCVLGMSAIGGLTQITRRPKKRSARMPKRSRAPKAARRTY